MELSRSSHRSSWPRSRRRAPERTTGSRRPPATPPRTRSCTRPRRSARSTHHTRAVTAFDASAAAAAAAGGPSGRGRVGSGRRLAGRRRARRAAAERQGARLRLDRRQRDRDVPRARPHAGDRVGSGDGHPDAGQRRHRLQRLLQRPGASARRPDVPGRREQGRSSSTASSRRTSSIPRRTCGASARTWRPGAGIRPSRR